MQMSLNKIGKRDQIIQRFGIHQYRSTLRNIRETALYFWYQFQEFFFPSPGKR